MDHLCPACGDTCDCLWPEDCRHCVDLDELEDLGQQTLFGDTEDFGG